MINEQIVDSTRNLARQLFDQLKTRNQKIVFAESCTAGLVAAVMGGIPGVSAHLCGSAVTYQNETKESWLQINPHQIQNHSAVSGDVTTSMAVAVLEKTPDADVAVAVTGHLQPDAAAAGSQAWVVAATRGKEKIECTAPRCFPLQQATRVDRQWEAANYTLQISLDIITRN